MGTFETVKEIIVDTLSIGESEISETTDLVKDLNLDSLDIVELTVALEDKYGIKIPQDDIQGLVSVDKIVAYIDAHKA